jgi:hypothetical protein
MPVTSAKQFADLLERGDEVWRTHRQWHILGERTREWNSGTAIDTNRTRDRDAPHTPLPCNLHDVEEAAQRPTCRLHWWLGAGGPGHRTSKVDDPRDLVPSANGTHHLEIGDVGLLDGDCFIETTDGNRGIAALNQDTFLACVEERLYGVGPDES